MKNRLLLPAGPKRILVTGSIKKYVVAGEQKAIVNVVAADKDKYSQEYARKRFNNLLQNFINAN